jgi:hypothetical protein
MNIGNGYGVASNYNCYNAKNASQASSKSFTVNTEIRVEAPMIGPLTYIGDYSKFDPFKEIAETGSFNIPDGMQTKRTPTRSDEEILKDMEELAKEHARTGMLQKDDERFAKLMDEYISSVSPDRAGILKSSISEILGKIEIEMSGMEGLEKKEKNNLINILMETLDVEEGGNKGKDGNDIINDIINAILARGNNITTSGNIYSNNDIASNMYDNVFVQNGVVESASFYDSNGEKIMDYFSNSEFGGGGLKLMQKYTKAENERMQEIVGVYNAAFDIAYGSQIHGNNNNGNSTMNKAYNSTYERLRSEVA